MKISYRLVSWVMTISGTIGLGASFALAYDEHMMRTNPFYVPPCAVNEVVNYATVMNSPQSELFGFPNPYGGLIAFSIVLALGIGGIAGGCYARWLWNGLLAGLCVGSGFVFWFAYQSIFKIGSFCPYCVITWACTLVLWGTILVFNRKSKNIQQPLTSAKSAPR